MSALLNRRILLFGVIAVSLAAIAYTLARVFRDILTVLLVLIILALVVVVVVMWLRQRRAAQGAAEIERTIVRQADRDIEKSIPAQAADLVNMKADLLTAIEALKSSKGGAGALASLPWYLVLGPRGAGKGALVQNSGLSFPLKDASGRGPRSVRGVGGTRTLEWWLSEQAVLLEMPGQLLRAAEFEDTDDWLAFLGVIRKRRPARPINGVIVPIAVDQVADQPPAEVEKLGRRVRDRVVELVHHLGVTFPTYVVFTSCDRLAGFSEFFGDVDAGKRAQAWGATIPVSAARGQHADELFDAEFQTLTGALSRRWVEKLAALSDDEQRSRAFAFPLQLERLRPSLRSFVKTLFDASVPGEQPLFRGFYFTSASPAGAAVDRVYPQAATSVGLSLAPAPAPTPAGGGAWFVGDLFTKVIFPDRDLVTESDTSMERRRRRRVVLFGTLGLLWLVLFALFAVVSCSNGDLVERTRRAALHVKDVSVHGAFEDKVEALDHMRADIAKLEAVRAHTPWWRHLGGYWGNEVIDPALEVFARHTLNTLVRPALPRMDAELAAATGSGAGAGPASFVPQLYRYWAWRLLRKPDEMHPEDSRVVAAEVRLGLTSELEGVQPGRRDTVGAMVERNVDFLAAHERLVAQNAGIYLGAEPADLMTRVTNWLTLSWDRRAFYEDLVARQIEPRTQALGLGALIGRTEPLSSTAQVPGSYTTEGWRKVARPLLDWYRARLVEPWAEPVGDSARALAGDLNARYAHGYTQAWNAFLSSVRASSSPDKQTCAGLVNGLARKDSPLFALLRQAAAQTRFTSDPGPGVEAVQQDFEILQSFELAPQAGSRRGLGGTIGGLFGRKAKGGSFDMMSSEKQNYVRLLGVLVQKSQDLAQPAAASDAYNAIFISLSGKEASVVDQFRAEAQSLLDKHTGHAGNDATVATLWLPLTVLGQVGTVPPPPREAAKTPDKLAPSHGLPPNVNAAWQQQVVAPFQARLAGKYPLSASGPDLPLADFADFFRPGGTFWSFYDQALKPYIAENGTPVPGAAAVVSPALINAVRTAHDIREAFFAAGGPVLNFMVRNGPPDTVHVTSRYSLAWIDFELGGQPPVHYLMGAATWTPRAWPGPQPDAGASVRANGRNQTFGSQQAGVWGLFRLLDKGAFGGTDVTPEVKLRVSNGPDTWSLPFDFQLQGQSPNTPFRKNFLRFSLPPSI